jgi:hypothetical protein
MGDFFAQAKACLLMGTATDNLYTIFKRTAQLNFQMIGGKNESVSKIRRINNPLFASGIRKEKSCHASKAPLSMWEMPYVFG